MSHVLHIKSVNEVYRFANRLITSVEAGRDLKVTVERWKKSRTVDQNRRMWAILTQLSRCAPPHMDGQWYSPEIWHEYMKRRFLGVEPGPFGEVVPKSTAKLSTLEFSGYCDQIEAWCAEEGIVLIDE